MNHDVEAKIVKAEMILMMTDEVQRATELFFEIKDELKAMPKVPAHYVNRFVWIAERIKSRR
jgi:hypothetical protein